MNDLEERLRSDLLLAARGVESDIDEHDVLAWGRRTRHSRRVRRVAVAAALALAIGVAGWAGLAHEVGGGTVPVIATPVPGTATPTPSRSVRVGVKASVTFGTDDPFPADLKIRRVTVTATSVAAGRVDADVTVVASDGSASSHTVTTVGDDLAWVQVAPRLVVGLVPHSFDWVQYLDAGDNVAMGGTSSDWRVMDSLDATAYYRLFDKKGTYSGSAGYLWRNGKGEFRDSRGEVVPSVTIGLPGSGQERTFYEDDALDVLGFQQDSGEVSTTVARDQVQSFGGFAQRDGDLAVAGIVLPEGASNPALSSSAKDLEWSTGAIGGRMAIVASAHLVRVSDSVVQAVTYTDAHGQRVTKKLR
jgi:hypothetical protein